MKKTFKYRSNPIRDTVIVTFAIAGVPHQKIAEFIKEPVEAIPYILEQLRPQIEKAHRGIARQVAQGVFDWYMRKSGFSKKKRCFRPT